MAALSRRLAERGVRGLERLRADQRGQSLVEFALVTPVFLLLLLGIVEFARAWNVHHALTHTAREGARLAVLARSSVTEDSVRAAIRTALASAALDTTKLQLVLTGVTGDPGTPARVEVGYPHTFLFAGPWAEAVGGTLMLRSAAVMRNE